MAARNKSKKSLTCASERAGCQQRERGEEKEREGERERGKAWGVGTAVFFITLIFTPAAGGGKCQALIELIKPF